MVFCLRVLDIKDCRLKAIKPKEYKSAFMIELKCISMFKVLRVL